MGWTALVSHYTVQITNVQVYICSSGEAAGSGGSGAADRGECAAAAAAGDVRHPDADTHTGGAGAHLSAR